MSIIHDFLSDEYYEVSSLNMILGCFTQSGCVGKDDLKVLYNSGNAVVSQGACILPDKQVITVDKGGVTAATDFYNGYIFISNSQICAGDVPENPGSDFFLLAHIEDGTITDLRQRASIYTEEGNSV